MGVLEGSELDLRHVEPNAMERHAEIERPCGVSHLADARRRLVQPSDPSQHRTRQPAGDEGFGAHGCVQGDEQGIDGSKRLLGGRAVGPPLLCTPLLGGPVLG